MEAIAGMFVDSLRQPVLAFLLAGMVVGAANSKLRIPEAVYQLCVLMLLLKIGLAGGMAIRNGDISEMIVPAIISAILGIGIVLLGSVTLARLPGVKNDDAIATVGLFGAVSASTLAVAMVALENSGIYFEGWMPALYPFMDIPALLTAIVLANIHLAKQNTNYEKVDIVPIIKDSLRGQAITILIVGVTLGLLARPEGVYESFFGPLFMGFLSILMLSSGIEASRRLKELLACAHWYIMYAFLGPLVHGLAGFGLGYIAHLLVGLSPGGVILLAIVAASSADISGPPTIRAGIPSANPSVYQGTSTGLGTTVVIALYVPLFLAMGKAVFGL